MDSEVETLMDEDNMDAPDDSSTEVTPDEMGAPEDQTLEDKAVLTQEDLVAFQRLCSRLQELAESLQAEDAVLREKPLREYERLQGLKGALGVTDAVCGECARSMATLTSHLGELRKGLTTVASTLEEKLAAEGARSWVLEINAPEIDYTKQAKQKALIAQAAQARSIAGKARSEVSVLVNNAATLEAEAAQASADSTLASGEAEALSRRAEEYQKAVVLKAEANAEAFRKAEAQRNRREAEEQKQKEDEERQKLETSQRLLTPEEEERRNATQSRLDTNSWPMFVYSIDAGDIDIPIACVVRSLPDTFTRDDMEVEPLAQLDDVLPLDENEELVSHIINLIPTSGETELNMETPLAVALPHVAPRNLGRETIIKQRMPNGEWEEIDSYDVTIEDIKEFKFVEVRLWDLAPLAVLTRLRKETFTLTRKGGKLITAVDTRITLSARPATVRVATHFTFEVHPVELSAVSELKIRNPDVTEQLLSSSPIISLFSAVKRFAKAVIVTLPVPPPPPDKSKARPSTASPPSGGSAANKNCNDISATDLPRPASAFIGFRNKKEEEVEDMLHLVTWDVSMQAWTKVPNVTFTQSKKKDIATFDCRNYKLIKRFLILRTKVGVTDGRVETMARTLEESLKQRTVQMVLRQLCNNLQEVTLLCAPILKSERFQRNLIENGYGMGPPPSREVLVREGQKMEVRFRGNIKDEEETTRRFAFNSQIKTKLDFSVTEIDRFAQKGIDCYRGFVQVYTRGMVEMEVPRGESKKTEWVEGDVLLAEMLVSLPKPEPEPPKPLEKAPVSIKGEGLINETLLRHLSTEIGDEWCCLARYLNLRRVRIQAIMRNNVNREPENAVYDMLLTWAKKVPHSCNKVEMLCQALGYVGRIDLVEEMRDRERDYREDRAQLLRDSVLKKAFVKVAQNANVTADWKFLARHLGVPEAELEGIERDHAGLRERCLQSLVRWKEREGSAATAEALLKYLRRCRYHNVIAQVKILL